MFATITAIRRGYEIELATNPFASAICQSGTCPVETADQSVGLFNLERRKRRPSRSCNRTNANLERHGRRAETGHFCSAANNDEADTCIQRGACEGWQ